jgi:hypothetical protein
MEQILTLINDKTLSKNNYEEIIKACYIKLKVLERNSKQKYYDKINEIIADQTIISKDNPAYDYINNIKLYDIDINIKENTEHGLTKYDFDKYGHHLYSSYYYSIKFTKDEYQIIFSFDVSTEWLKEEYHNSDGDELSINNRRTINIYNKEEKFDCYKCDKNPITQFYKYYEWELEPLHMYEFKQFLNKLFSIFECKYELKWKDKNKY